MNNIMNRVTQTHLDDALKTLNNIKPMEGAHFALDRAYGGYRIVKRYDATGGEHDLTNRGTAREIYDIMRGIEEFYRA